MGWLYDDCKHCGEHYMALLWPFDVIGRWMVAREKQTITVVRIGDMDARCKKCGGALSD